MRILVSIAAVSMLATVFDARAQSAGAPGQAMANGCDQAMSPEVNAAWENVGGRDGRLGCPLGPEGDTATSVSGTAAREARFQGGEIIRHMSGPLSGKAFAVAACGRTYVQYGGPSGWLGLPVSDAVNTPDGQRQRFEGGTLTLYRATENCEAERN